MTNTEIHHCLKKVCLCQLKQVASEHDSSAVETSMEYLGLLICKKALAPVLLRPYKLNRDHPMFRTVVVCL